MSAQTPFTLAHVHQLHHCLVQMHSVSLKLALFHSHVRQDPFSRLALSHIILRELTRTCSAKLQSFWKKSVPVAWRVDEQWGWLSSIIICKDSSSFGYLCLLESGFAAAEWTGRIAMIFNRHQRCGYSNSPFARIYYFYTGGSRNGLQGVDSSGTQGGLHGKTHTKRSCP